MKRLPEKMQKGHKKIGLKIRELRYAKGLTSVGLGRKIGVSNQQVSKYEDGSVRICIQRLLLVAKELNVKLEYFIEDTDVVANKRERLTLEVVRNFAKIKSATDQDNIALQIKLLAQLNEEEKS
jgi:transcriptional regulator with XRE-family HTH domain